MARESLCWSCRRAYAKPDPDGCGFHRREHEQVFSERELKESMHTQKNGIYTYIKIVVTKCEHYEMSENILASARKAYKQKVPKYPQEAVKRAAEMYKAGQSYKEISAMLGCHPGSVSNLLKREGVKLGGRRVPKGGIRDEQDPVPQQRTSD
ncbi:MAG: helix-turn-helix domain-containing protein [Bacteroidales bacterium]|nr:helix-turn-helix domain-containing protein [Bacteroidales bacterium]